ncbi:MAG: type I restriction-modification enzyme R subunit C-terminal domain-containing protein [Thermoanaerobaculaceae bacterium]
MDEREWETRRRRIDPRLAAAGWDVRPYSPLHRPGPGQGVAETELPTEHGPADYALTLDGRVVGIVEAKRIGVGTQEVLTQAERYARGLTGSPFNFEGLRTPFLYATNGEAIHFRDVRHPLARARKLAAFHTPQALRELLDRDHEGALAALQVLPNDHARLRPYQREANAAVENAIARRRREMLLAMATGTGKTFTLVNQVYRLMKSKVATRILFLVDRRALAAQAVRAFASFEPEPGLKFNQVYEVYNQRFRREDLEDEPFDPKTLPAAYLTNPHRGHAFVYVCTIQRMAVNVLGRNAILGLGDEELDEDAERLDIPIHAFDLVIADECHRGYTSQELSVWRSTLDHFDAIKIGLTATPAAHTTSYFRDVVFRYEYERAVREGFLVDYDAVAIRSDVRMRGVFLGEGEQVGVVDTQTGAQRLDLLEDERQFDPGDVEKRVTSPDSNRKIVEELKRHALAHEREWGRFPKTLIFADNDLPHTSHADQLVEICRDVFDRGDAFVAKITGRVDRPLQRIREFRNRPTPAIAVTVDLLSTGVDIPDLEYIVFLRTVRSRILFEQMLGRGTRKGDHHPDKSHFTVFDCFDGSLLAYFRQATGITAEPPTPPSRTIREIVEDIWANRDRDYNVRCLVKRLQRIDKQMAAEARPLFAAFVEDGDLAHFARALPRRLADDFTGTMQLLRNPAFLDLLEDYPRARRTFLIGYGTVDTVTSRALIHTERGEYKPDDYLHAFAAFVRTHRDEIDAIRILLDRPRDWRPHALTELRNAMAATPERFTLRHLQQAVELHHHKALVEIISMVKHAADDQSPLWTAPERVDRAIAAITAGRQLTAEQQRWLDRIRLHLVENLSLDLDDFDLIPALSREGGLAAATRVFGGTLKQLVSDINAALAA